MRLLRLTRKAHGESASDSWHVAHAQAASFAANGTPGDCKTEAQPASVEAALRERSEHLLGESRWKATAVVLDVDDV